MKNNKQPLSEWYPYLDQTKVAPFRSQASSVEKETAYLLPIVNRRYNTNSFQMEKFGIPIYIAIPSWISWREFHLQIYLQVKRYIDYEYIIKKIITNKNKGLNKLQSSPPDKQFSVRNKDEDKILLRSPS